MRLGLTLAWAALPDRLHPLVDEVPPEAQTDLQSVARYLAEREPDLALRAKALHDWVADNVAYDTASLADGSYAGKQEAQEVFRTRKAVCDGYVNLLVAMGEAAQLHFVPISGETHAQSPKGHAWAAVELQGRWWLLDPTWGAGYVEDGAYVERYTADWLFVPPEVFGYTHLPDQAQWQLVEAPVSREDFLRRQPLRPAFFRQGYALLSPLESPGAPQGRALVAVLDNPRGRWLRAELDGRPCQVRRSARRLEVRCTPPGPGTYEIALYDGEAQRGSYTWLGALTLRAQDQDRR
jgi:hypothetical protein